MEKNRFHSGVKPAEVPDQSLEETLGQLFNKHIWMPNVCLALHSDHGRVTNHRSLCPCAQEKQVQVILLNPNSTSCSSLQVIWIWNQVLCYVKIYQYLAPRSWFLIPFSNIRNWRSWKKMTDSSRAKAGWGKMSLNTFTYAHTHIHTMMGTHQRDMRVNCKSWWCPKLKKIKEHNLSI